MILPIILGALALAGLHLPPENGCAGARFLGSLCSSASAGEKKADKLSLTGAWGKKDGELKIEFADKDVLKIAPTVTVP